MKWVAPIKDEMSIQRICSELEKIDQKYLVLFLVGIGTGLQLQEILNLRVREVRGKDFITSSIGTRDVKRAFYIPADLRTVIDDFTKGKDEESYLICGYGKRTAQPLSREQAYRVLKQAGSKAGQPELCAATMRKTFAWRYYRRTGDDAENICLAVLQKDRRHLLYSGSDESQLAFCDIPFYWDSAGP